MSSTSLFSFNFWFCLLLLIGGDIIVLTKGDIEFLISEQLESSSSDSSNNNEVCTMKCLNGGSCKIGTRLATKAELALHPYYNPNTNNNNKNKQHCQCLHGYYGMQCESSFDVCRSNNIESGTNDVANNVCHNNSTCVYTKGLSVLGGNRPVDIGLPEFMCNCTVAARSGKKFGGNQCQYQNIISCNDDDRSSSYFCTNGGACVKDINNILE